MISWWPYRTFVAMFPPMWLFNVSISIVVFCEKRTAKIKHPLKRKGGYLWWPPCCRWQLLCLLFLEWQPYPRPAKVVDHRAYLFHFRNTWQNQWTTNDNVICRGIISQYPRCTYMSWSLARVHILFFHLVNNKLHCGFHHCRLCFSFSGGFHVSGQIWP